MKPHKKQTFIPAPPQRREGFWEWIITHPYFCVVSFTHSPASAESAQGKQDKYWFWESSGGTWGVKCAKGGSISRHSQETTWKPLAGKCLFHSHWKEVKQLQQLGIHALCYSFDTSFCLTSCTCRALWFPCIHRTWISSFLLDEHSCTGFTDLCVLWKMSKWAENIY